MEWKEAAHDIAINLLRHCNHWSIQLVWIEEPTQFHSPGGHAVLLSGALQKLFFTVGFISGTLRRVAHISYVPVMDWKGQLPKQLTTIRVNRKYNLSLNWRTKWHNAADAIAMGDWYLNQRKENKHV